MSENSFTAIRQVKELYSDFQVNQHLKAGWKLLAVTALTHRHDRGHEEAQTIYVLGSEEEPSEEEVKFDFGDDNPIIPTEHPLNP